MRKHEQLYFIALVPPEPIKSELQLIKDDFSKLYGCKAALKSPPHITLHMPFRFPEKREDELIEKLNDTSVISSFNLKFNDFGCFAPRVIFINVEIKDELNHLFSEIQRTMKALNIFNAGYKNHGFNPHLTIAFRDLKKSIFPEAWENFKNKKYHSEFEVNEFCLLKHNGKYWEDYIQIAVD